jgi:hypothetical protein
MTTRRNQQDELMGRERELKAPLVMGRWSLQ